MKRTTLMVDASALQQASRALGTKTYSDTVNTALREAVRLAQIRSLTELFGTGAWTGDLAQMRQDAPTKPGKKARRR